MTRALAVLGLMFVALLAASPTAAQPAAAPVSIDVGDDWFCNPSFEGQVCQTNLTAGDTVVWTLTEKDHTVTQCQDGTFSDCSGGWDSGILDAGQSFQQSFNSAGTFYYRCNLHPGDMFGQLNVSAAPTPTSVPPPPPTPTSVPPPPPSGGQTPSSGGASISDEAPTSGGTTTNAPTGGGTTTDESPSPTAQPYGADRSPTLSLSGRTAEGRSSAITPVVPRDAQAPGDDSSGGSWFWVYALIGAGGGLTLLVGGTLIFHRYRHRLFPHD